jgi:hypothetical protein
VLQNRVHPSQQKFFDLSVSVVHLPCESTQVRFIHLISFLAGACNLIILIVLKIELTKIVD